jgi:hypothetical protein
VHLTRLEQDDIEVCVAQRIDDITLITAGRLKPDTSNAVLRQFDHQRGAAFIVIWKLPALGTA